MIDIPKMIYLVTVESILLPVFKHATLNNSRNNIKFQFRVAWKIQRHIYIYTISHILNCKKFTI